PDRDVELVAVNDAGEKLSDPLAPGCLGEQVFILSEEHTAKFGGSIEQIWVFQFRRAIKLCRHYIHTPQHESARDGRRHVHVHIEPNAHLSLPISRKRLRIGDSPACARSFSTSCTLR